MPIRCVALLSGGLDSILAIRLMQEQQIDVWAVNFKTPFTCCQDTSARVAARLGVPLTIAAAEDDYFELVRAPRHGYGKGANPCIDCRIYMFRRAARFLDEVDARFVISGEVVGQRPKSQKRRDLELIARESGLGERLLRPLSARRLPVTWPERMGWVDRQRLGDFTGRSRKGLIQLAGRLGVTEIPVPSSGCALTEPRFARKVLDLVQLTVAPARWDFELLQVGRHYRYDERTKLVVGRRESENQWLREAAGRATGACAATTLLTPDGFPGPSVLVVGPVSADVLAFGAGLVHRHCRLPMQANPQIAVRAADGTWQRIPAVPHPAATLAHTLPDTAAGP